MLGLLLAGFLDHVLLLGDISCDLRGRCHEITPQALHVGVALSHELGHFTDRIRDRLLDRPIQHSVPLNKLRSDRSAKRTKLVDRVQLPPSECFSLSIIEGRCSSGETNPALAGINYLDLNDISRH
jgi:hypothetical protein